MFKEAWEDFLAKLEELRERRALEKEQREIEHENRRLEKERIAAEKHAEKERLLEEKRQAEEAKKEEQRRLKQEEENRKAAARAEKERIAREKEEQRRKEREERDKRLKEERQKKQEELERQRKEREALREAVREAQRKEEEEREAEKRAKLEEEEHKKAQAKKLRDEEEKKAAEIKRADKEYKEKQKEEKRKERERIRLEKRKKRLTKTDKKANKKLAELEAQLRNQGNTEENPEQEIQSLQDKIGKKKSSSNLKNLLTLSLTNKSNLIIEVKEDKTYIAEVTVTGSAEFETKRVTVNDMVVIDTPESTFVNGMPYNIDRLALEIMKALVNSGISSKEVIFVSNDKTVFARDLTDVHLQSSEKQNLEMIRNMSIELFPVDLADYIIRYRIIEKQTVGGAKEKPNISLNIDMNTLKGMFQKDEEVATVKVIAFPKQLEETYRRLASLSSLTLTSIDYSLNSAINFITREFRDKTEFVLDVNSDSTTLFLVAHGKILAQDSVNTGYNAIWQKVTLYNNTNLGENINEVLHTIKHYGLLEDEQKLQAFAEEKGLKPLEVNELYSLLDEIREDLAKILNSAIHMIDIQRAHYSDIEINTATLLCSKKDFPDLTEDFLQGGNITLNSNSNYLWITTLENDVSINEFRHIIGSALGTLNFKDKAQELTKETERTLKFCASFIVAFGLLGIGGAIGYSQYMVDSKHAEKAELEQTLLDYQEAEQIAKRHNLSMTTLNQVVEFNDYTSNSDQLVEIIEQLEESTPKNIIYDTIISSDSTLLLSFKAKTREEIIKLLDVLQSFEYFDVVSTSGVTTEEDSETGSILYVMTVTCEYHEELPPPPPETTAAPAESTEASSDDIGV